MCIKQYEFLHGSVLIRISKNDPDATLMMVEKSTDSRSIYTINDEAILYIKHSKTPTVNREVNPNRRNWQFTFSINNLRELAAAKKDVHFVLVCAEESLNSNQSEFCFVSLKFAQKYLDLKDLSKPQTLHVEDDGSGMLRLYSHKRANNAANIARNALDAWVIPGS